jgi:DNA ligase-1
VPTQFNKLVEVSRRISETSRRLQKIGLLAEFLKRSAPDEIPIAVSYLSGNLRQGKIGIGYASLRDATLSPQSTQPLTLYEVDAAFQRISETAGPGSSAVRLQLIQDLVSRADAGERDFLFRLIVGELRQGSLEGIMIEALARAADVPVEKMRTAVMLSGDLPLAARAALEHGSSGLAQFKIRILHPFQPMLAQSAGTISEAMHSIAIAALEYKMDGIRIQAHKSGKEVRIFTRNLNDVTEAVPDLSEILLDFAAQEIVLDGEALSFGKGGKPRRFQDTMRRFGRKLNVPELRNKLPLTPFFFDCLYLDGDSLIEKSESERFSALEKIAAPDYLMPRRVSSEPDAAGAFLQESMNAGHEGIMVKDPDAPYEPGVRSNHWLKVKPAHTLDLVVLAAEWGHGRRRGRLSNLHLGARDPESRQFIMLGKTFKGLTDTMLEWQTKRLLEIESSRDQWTVYVRPELVVEIALNDIQSSPHYPAGLALRFARVKRYRPDKSPEEADTIQTVRAIAAKDE